MSGEMILLEQWVREVAGAVQGRKRQYYIFFQKDWTQSHMNNPLLFPLEQTPEQWKSHFDWFLTFETFKPANQDNAPGSTLPLPDETPAVPTKTKATPITAEKAAAETVVMDALENVEEFKTMIYEASADQGTMTINVPPEKREKPVADGATQGQADAPVQDGTMIAAPEPEAPPESADDDLGDLDDLVEANEAQKPPQPPSAGKAEPVEPRTEEEAYTIIMDEPEAESSHDGTMVMETEPEPAPKPTEKKKPNSAAGGDLELELDDLDDMDWE